jgi:anti-sigma B factor antagonist
MTNESKSKKGVHRLKPEGEMTIYNAATMKTFILTALRKYKEVEIDLAKVNEMDSAGLQLLFLAKREASNHGKPLRLINHSEAALEIFNLYHVAEHFGDPIVLRRNGN